MSSSFSASEKRLAGKTVGSCERVWGGERRRGEQAGAEVLGSRVMDSYDQVHLYIYMFQVWERLT